MNRHCLALTLSLLCFALTAPEPSQALDVQELNIVAGPARLAGVFTDYFVEFSIDGTDLQTATITTPLGGMVAMNCDGNNCDLELQTFDDLADIQASLGFGDFTFAIQGVAVNDSAVVPFSPGVVDLTGFPSITSPLHLATGVAADAPIIWSCVGGAALCNAVDAQEAELEKLGSDEETEELFLDNTTSSWSHPLLPIESDEIYIAGITLFKLLPESDDMATTAQLSDPFEYNAVYGSFNEVQFAPEPGATLALAGALLALGGLAGGRRRR